LDRAREQHRHHGLTFEDTRNGRLPLPLEQAASGLIARPLITGERKRSGTFELWHQSARETPMIGKVVEQHSSGATLERTAVIGNVTDRRLPELPSSGITLLECLRHLPGMYEYLNELAIQPQTLRARVERRLTNEGQQQRLQITVHPSDLAEEFFGNVLLPATSHENVTFQPLRNSGIFSLSGNSSDTGHWTGRTGSIPCCTAWTIGECRFWPHETPLNEFGYLYAALFIAGNYARYYPDRWVLDVESSTPVALAIEELLRTADNRLPWLALSELERKYYVDEG